MSGWRHSLACLLWVFNHQFGHQSIKQCERFYGFEGWTKSEGGAGAKHRESVGVAFASKGPSRIAVPASIVLFILGAYA